MKLFQNICKTLGLGVVIAAVSYVIYDFILKLIKWYIPISESITLVMLIIASLWLFDKLTGYDFINKML